MGRPFQNFWGIPSKAGEGTRFGAFVDIGCDSIGERCTIQSFVSIPPGWKIGNDVFIGPGVHFANDKYPKANGKWKLLLGRVEDGASIGMGALIGAGITIGKGAIIGMGAVVLKNVPAGEKWVGNPAHKI